MRVTSNWPSRLAQHAPDMQFDLNVILMTLLLSDRVGVVVMWAYTLVMETRKGGLINMGRLASLFPVGFPTEDGYHDFWEGQKTREGVHGDNMLDHPGFWKE
jgi:hypothetical protein